MPGGEGEHSLAKFIKSLRRKRRRLELGRLLYVTATRARRALHWFGHATADRDGELKPDARSLLHELWPAIGAEFERQYRAAMTMPATGSPTGTSLQVETVTPRVLRHRLSADWQPVGIPVPVQRLPLAVQPTTSAVEYSWVGQTARAVGTIVHAELQRCAQQADVASGAAPWLSRARYEEWLAQLGVERAQRQMAADQVLTALQRTAADERGRWLLSSSNHREAHSERRLSGMHEGRIVNIVIDRMLIDRAGTRWIIDFKTSSHEGSDLVGFVDREVQRYYPQLQRYAALAASLGAEPVRCALYFPLLGVFREVAMEAQTGL
jgi:ATP-dependent helicase/nuclease subunit A